MKALTILTLFVLISLKGIGQCTGTYIISIPKDSTIQAECDDMVLMNLGTFSAYYLYEKQIMELREKVPELKKIIKQVEKENKDNRSDMDSVIENQNKIIHNEKMSKESAVVQAKKQYRRAEKEKKKKNFWKAIAAGEGAALLLLILLL